MSPSHVWFKETVQMVLIDASGFPGSLGKVAVLHVEVVGGEEKGPLAAKGISALINV